MVSLFQIFHEHLSVADATLEPGSVTDYKKNKALDFKKLINIVLIND